jgi:hydroxymethylpyrimidine pyrophosphatase-like HAD family hydrolase
LRVLFSATGGFYDESKHLKQVLKREKLNYKLAVFDLDGTLAEIGMPMEAETIAGLRRLQARGVQVVLCSGKPVSHLCGFLRQSGLPEAIVMGENGAVTQWGIELPPRRHFRLPYDKSAAIHLTKIRALIEEKIRPVPWFQPGEVVLTPFFSDEAQRKALQALIDEYVKPEMGLQVFPHTDSFDICPAGISKGAALKRLIRELGIEKRQVAAIGDGANDVPLWAEAGFSIQVGSKVAARVDMQVTTILEAIQVLMK